MSVPTPFRNGTQAAGREHSVREHVAREHHWDFARGLLMLLGIPYHVAMCLRAGDPWIVASPRGGLAYTWIADAIHLFRMPAFFIVAGYFTAMLLARKPAGAWLRGRMMRLGVPFLAALVLVVPVLNIACELSSQDWPAAQSAFLRNMRESGGYWIRHLWFLIVLGYASAIAAGAVAWWPGLAHARFARSLRRPHVVLLGLALAAGAWAMAAPLPFAGLTPYAARWVREIFRLDEALLYLPWFALGTAIRRSPGLSTLFARTTPALILLTIATALGAIAAIHAAVPPWVAATAGGAAGLLLTHMLLALAKLWFDRPSAWIDGIVGTAFVIYLLHLPVLAILLDLTMPLGWPLPLQFAFVCVATFALCHAAARGIAARPSLDFLFNGRRRADEGSDQGLPSCIQSRAGSR